MNHKKLRRLYKDEGLAVKRRRGRKRATGTREPMPVPGRPVEAVESRLCVRRVRTGPPVPHALHHR
jgi:transposase InsO family protein